MSLDNQKLILAFDGQRAVCFISQLGPWPHLKQIWREERKARLDHDQGRDRPGRYQRARCLPRSSYRCYSHHDADITRFINTITLRIKATLRDQGCNSLVVVAPPAALGRFRRLAPEGLRRQISREIPRDYSGIPVTRVEELLQKQREMKR